MASLTARRVPHSGVCHICEAYGPLSFEHVPPRAAFNDHPVVQLSGAGLFSVSPDDLRATKGPISQRGAGAYTLCPPCNNKTGAWYGAAFADWAAQGMHLLQHAQAAPSLYHLFHIFPLRVIKQIYCMFFSANPTSFAHRQQDLVRLVLNREFRFADPSLRVFAYFNAAPLSRQSAITGRADFASGSTHVYSEVAFPPFGYILSVDGKCPDNRLVEISHFSHYSYNRWLDVALKLPVFQPYTAYPGDFRSREEVIRESGLPDLKPVIR